MARRLLLTFAACVGCGGGDSSAPRCEADCAAPPPAPAPTAGQPTPDDAAEIVSASLPSSMACAEPRAAVVKVRNTGRATWTRARAYALVAPGGSDPLDSDARASLADGDAVAPGATHDFVLPMVAPLTTGLSLQTGWRMIHGAVAFGPTASQTALVTCDGEAAFAKATVYNSANDTASWPVTTKITKLEIRTDGVVVTFDKKDGSQRWPDVTPPGWTGPIQYTLWLMLHVNGAWAASGIIQYWYGLEASGGDVTKDAQIAKNWVYDGRWGPMAAHQPAPGEAVGFMVTAGNARGVPDASQSARERSNMVVVAFPSTANATFTF